jgi:quercetin dioxygenase-like cupin family protein
VIILLIRHSEEVKEESVTQYGSMKTSIRWLISKEQGAPRFAMRLFEVQPSGNIGMHNHPEEHEMFFLEGEIDLIKENGDKVTVKAGDAVYMPPNEKHGYENNSSEIVRFICMIPLLKK